MSNKEGKERELPSAKAFPSKIVRAISMLRSPSSEAIYGDMPTQSKPDLVAISESVKENTTNIIKHLPDIQSMLEESCLDDSDNCTKIWNVLHPLLKELKNPQTPKSPKCAKKPIFTQNIHGDQMQDDYAWLKDKDDDEVKEYIKAENNYTDCVLKANKQLKDILYKEFVSRLDEEQESVHVSFPDGYSYYNRKVHDKEYKLHCRVNLEGNEDVYLDENNLAWSEEFEDAPFFRISFLKLSHDCKILAYGVDSTGQERNTVYFMDMETKNILPDRIYDVYEDLEFSRESDCVYYTILDECERAYQLKRHLIGEDVSRDEVLFHEQDEMFFLSLRITYDERYIILTSSAQVTTEVHYCSANKTDSPCVLLIPRIDAIRVKVGHHNSYFYILTNEKGKNNWIYRIPVVDNYNSTSTLSFRRETVLEHRDFVLVEDFQFTSNNLIVLERSNCRQNLRIISMANVKEGIFSDFHYVVFSELVYSVWLGSVDYGVPYLRRHQYDTHIFTFLFTSYLQPIQVIDYDMDQRILAVRHEENVCGRIPYDKSNYDSTRLFATSHDGTAIPISIVYRKDLLGIAMDKPATNPMLLHAYGVNPIFSSCRLSLLDRGFIYAVAHVRGGADMGNGWYEEGKLAKKPNSFKDFCSVAEHLIKEGYTTPERLAIYGRSAGGLLIGAVINQAPQLFRAALTEVPFVDVVNTMFDSSIPWTAFEFEEWGNPNDPEIYETMKTYCPYSNIDGEKLANNEYPDILVIGGMNDARVAYFEPLRLVAKMRNERDFYRIKNNAETTSSDRKILLQLEDVGHDGSGGIYATLDSLAFQYAFLISKLGAPVKLIDGQENDLGIATPQGFRNPLSKLKWHKNEKQKKSPLGMVRLPKWIHKLIKTPL